MNKMFWLPLAVSLHVSASQLPANSPDCTNPLTTSPVSQALLEGRVEHQVGELLALERVTDPSTHIEQVRAAVEKLISENRITRAQAEHVFADRVLGNYRPIILKYVVAELKARDYDDENVVDFILHFETAFSPETRIDFAIAVARRMLLTVSDAGAARKADDLERYLEFVESFGVDQATYASFRDTWKYVREAHAMTVVHFILTYIKRTAAQFEHDVQVTLDTAAIAPPPSEDFLSKVGRWFNPFDTPPKSSPIQRSLEQTALEMFNGFEVPKFLEKIEVLDGDRPAPPLLMDRFVSTADGGRIGALLERLEMSPPFAWEILVRAQLEYVNLKELTRLMDHPLFRRFDPQLQEAVRAQREVFEHLQAAAISLYEHRLEADLEHGQPNSRAIARFEERMDKILPRRLLETPEWLDGFRNSFAATLKLWDLSSADFIEIAKSVVAQTFSDGNGFRALAVLKILKDSSHKFVFAPGKLEQFFESLDVYQIRPNTFSPLSNASELPEFKKEMDPKKWGRKRQPGEPDPSAMAKADLDRIRELLPPAELTWRKDRDLEQIFLDYVRKQKESSFLNTDAVERAAGLDAKPSSGGIFSDSVWNQGPGGKFR